MNRRKSIKAIMAAAGAVVSLPAWAHQWTRDTVPTASDAFSADEQQMIAAIADTIIPAGKDVGALSVGVDKFLVSLLDQCYELEVQQNVKRQIVELNAKSQAVNQRDFTLCDQPQRESLLLSFADSSDTASKEFFDLMKSETIRGFNTSKEVMLGYLKYKMVPGHYYGCVEVTN